MRKGNFPFLATHVEITDTGTDGRGIGRFEQKVIFVDHAVPGDVLDVLVHSKEKKLFLGRIEKIISPSPWRVEAICSHYGFCGGCKWQTLDYKRQLFYKEKQVTDALTRIGHLDIGEAFPILACASPFHYRNKTEFTFSNRRWLPYGLHEGATADEKSNALGFHVARHFDKVLNVKECFLPDKRIDAIRNGLLAFAMENQLGFYDIKSQNGFLRNLVFRTSEATGELMLILIVGEPEQTKIDFVLNYLESNFPEISTLVSIVNEKKNPSYGDLTANFRKGPEFLTEKLDNWKFRVSPHSFFQTNTRQAHALYSVVKSWMGEKKIGTVYDLYCGAGSIGIFVSDLAEKIVGVEYIEAAVKDAEANIKLNGLSHLHFIAGDMKKILGPELVAKYGAPDLVITDPPRAGMDAKVIESLLALSPPKIIYVSCNPATQARDIALMAHQYRIVKIQPVDMFPQTAHVENVALLERK